MPVIATCCTQTNAPHGINIVSLALSFEYNNNMKQNDVDSRADIEQIVERFYADVLSDPIIGFIFTDIARIDLDAHLPLIVDFWCDIVLKRNDTAGGTVEPKRYSGNALRKHLELNQLIALKPGHFTRWLYLFEKAVHAGFGGPNAMLMTKRAEMVAQSISAALTDRKKNAMHLTLPKSQ